MTRKGQKAENDQLGIRRFDQAALKAVTAMLREYHLALGICLPNSQSPYNGLFLRVPTDGVLLSVGVVFLTVFSH